MSFVIGPEEQSNIAELSLDHDIGLGKVTTTYMKAGIKYMARNYDKPEMCLKKKDYAHVTAWVDRYLDIYKKKL